MTTDDKIQAIKASTVGIGGTSATAILTNIDIFFAALAGCLTSIYMGLKIYEWFKARNSREGSPSTEQET